VYKHVQDGRTMTKVEELTADRRRVELALMFGGDSEANQSAAQEALDSAEMRKKEFINLL
jgi:DNA repair ATPase RecN